MKNISKLILLSTFCLFSLQGFSAISADSSATVATEKETATEGLNKIIALYKAKDSETLIKIRYSEIYKMENKEDINKKVGYFGKRLAKEGYVEQVALIFESAAKLTPTFTHDGKPNSVETGTVAHFDMGEGRILKLYLMKNGLWGFHM